MSSISPPTDLLPPRRGGRPSSQTASAAGRPAGFARLAGARRGLVRPARALAAAALLALCGGLALPATAEAQTTLVSNIGHSTGHTLGGGADWSQRFTAGSNPSGYTLTAVDVVNVNPVSATSTPFTARVCETNASGFPTSNCTALTVSVPYEGGTLSLPAPAGITLAQGQTYAVVFGLENHSLENTLLDDEPISQPGWSIENQYDWYSDSVSAWQAGSNGRALLIAIKGTVVGGGTPSTPELSVGDASATEGGTMTFPVTLSEAVTDDVTATWTASFGSNEKDAAAADLVSMTGMLTIGGGDTAGTFTVTAAQDTTDEHDETFTVTLSEVSSNAQLATDPTATGTITDDDDPPSLSVADVSTSEASLLAEFVVTLSAESGKTVTVSFTASAETGDTAESPADFSGFAALGLTFDPGVLTVSQPVVVVDDSIVEPDETFTVTLSNVMNAVISAATAKGTITNDDTAAVTCTAPDLTGQQQIWTATLTVGTTATGWGFNSTSSPPIGALSDTGFDVDLTGATNSYTFTRIAVSDTGIAGAEQFGIVLDSSLAAADRAGLTLHVCDSDFTLSPASYNATLTSYSWSAPGADWSTYATRTLYLSVPAASSDATLSGLTVTAGGTDLVTFASGTKTYTAMVASDVAEVTVTPTTNDTGATVAYLDGDDATITDADTGVDGHQVTLAEGDNVIKVKVTAEDTNATQTYMVTVTRAAAMTPTCTLNTGDLWCGVVTVGGFEAFGSIAAYGFVDAATDTGALSDTGFSVGTNPYTIDLIYTGKLGTSNAGILYLSLTSALTAADKAKLVLHVDGSSASFAFSDATGPTSTHTYQWLNSGLDWSSTSEVTLRLREAVISTDATLSALVVNDGNADLTLTPTFASGKYTYTASVVSTVAEVTVTPTKNDTNATIEYLDESDATLTDANTTDTGHQVAVAEGDTVIKVKVTAEDGNATQTYMVTVKRAAADASTDATLSDLVVNDGNMDVTLMPGFASSTIAYMASVATAVTEVTVTPTPNDSGATIEYLDASSNVTLEDADTGVTGQQVAVAVGDTVIQVKVTAQDTTTTQIYKVTVSREAPPGPPAPTNFMARPAGDAKVALSWDAPASDSGVTRHEYQFKTDGSYGTWTAIANSAVGGANEASFTVPDLTNEVPHTFQLRVVSADGDGAEAMAGPVTPTPGICDRTQQVQDEILRQLSGVDDCAAVTVADLETVPRLVMEGKSITSLKAGDFAGLTAVTYIDLAGNQVGALPAKLFSGLTSLTEIVLDTSGVTSLPADAFSGLTALTRINLSGNQLGALPAELFSGLTSLTRLEAASAGITSLPAGLLSGLSELVYLNFSNNGFRVPAGLFSGLSKLEILLLDNNALTSTSFPDGVFSGLTALEQLYLNDNELTSLPDGLFSGLTALTSLDLRGNSTDPLPLTVTLEKVEDGQVRAKVLAGAPSDLILPVSVENGTLASGARGLQVAKGSVAGAPVSVIRTEETGDVTVDLGTPLPSLPTGHRGYEYVKAASGLPVEVPDALEREPGVEGALRLTDEEPYTHPDGHVGVKGRAEIFHAERWGTVSSDGFSRSTTYRFIEDLDTNGDPLGTYTYGVVANNAPALFCKAMGYTAGEYASGYGRSGVDSQPSESRMTYYPVGSTYPPDEPEPIWVDDMTCAAGDLDLAVGALPAPMAHCGFAGWGLHNSNHGEDAGVSCWNELESDAGRSYDPLTAAFEGLPEAHDGETAFSFRLAFSEAVAVTPEAMRTRALTVAGGAVTGAARVDGESGVWEITVTPDSREDLSITLALTEDCEAEGAVCTSDGRTLSAAPAHIVPGPGPETEPALTAELQGLPEAHDGETAFSFRLAFSEAVAVTPEAMRTRVLTAAGGAVTGAARVDGESGVWEITVTPDSREDLSITLARTEDCEAEGAVCTSDGRTLSAVPAHIVPGPGPETEPALTAELQGVPEAHDGEDTFHFRVAFSEDIGISFRSMRDASFTVDGGEVTAARRVEGRHDLWQITVEPDSDGDVAIALPGGRECAVSGAICTRGENRRQLANTPTATVSGPVDAVPESNTAATGTPAIGGTPQVGEALSASTSGISDADGLDDARFGYQWIRTDTDIQGATGATYTAVDADEGKRLKVRVSFTDDAGNAESLTSAATDAVAARPEPLTASFEGMPAEHAGQGSFSFRVAFSDGINISYKTVRDASFTVTGGEVTAARRVDGRRDLWKITIAPASHEALTVRLPETTDCDAGGAICTSDGRPLSHSLSATVAGPVGISVADARVEEGDGVALAFAVTLSRAASAALTVDYATADGSAHAGDDYRAASGTLTFAAGESSQTIEVAVLDDAHDEGEETLTLTLSNPSGGRLADGEATGTIENSDPLPRALLARFGRTAALHVVEHVEERLQAPREPGFRGRFAGRELRRGMERDIALNFLRQLGGTAGAGPLGAGAGGPLSGAPAAGTAPLGMPGPAGGGHLAAASGRMGGAMPMGGARGAMGMAAGPMGGPAGPDGRFDGGGLLRMGLGGGDVLTGSDFALGRETGHGGILSFWSRGAQSRFAGREGALSLGGDVRTTMFGADYAKGPVVTGLSLSHSRGLGEYAGVAGGQVASSVTGLYPWLGYKATDRITVWGVAGYGAGGLLLTPEGGPALESGLSMAMAAAGTRGELVAGGAGGFALAFKADALWVGTSIDGVDGPAGRLAATAAAVTRFRTGLEGSRAYTLAGRLSLKPSVEVGLRHDGGDAETGAGMDVGLGLIVSDAGSGLAVDVRVRTLLLHQAEGFSERGVALSLSYNPTPSTPLGFMARVAPSWGGQATSGAEALWGRQTMGGMAPGGVAQGNRLDGEVGYGLPVGSRFVGTPRVGFSTSEYGRDYRLGYGLGVVNRESLTFELGIDAQRRESPLVDGASNGAIGRGTVGW